MKKNVLFSPLFLYNLALITHDATMSVNPSITYTPCGFNLKNVSETVLLFFSKLYFQEIGPTF